MCWFSWFFLSSGSQLRYHHPIKTSGAKSLFTLAHVALVSALFTCFFVGLPEHNMRCLLIHCWGPGPNTVGFHTSLKLFIKGMK